MITSIKLFYQDLSPMVALYGAATENSDGWQCNVPAHEVFNGDPGALPAEQQLTIAEAKQLIDFTSGFTARLAPAKKNLRMLEMVRDISSSTGIPEPDVQRIVASILRNFKHVVVKGGQFDSPILKIRPHAKRASVGNATSTLATPQSAVLLIARK